MNSRDKELFESLKGKTLVSITGKVGDEEMTFVTSDNKKYLLWYQGDCCATCHIEDICGDLDDLIGHPLLVAEVSTNTNENPPGISPEYQDSFTWTYYKLDTIKGGVTIRWYGESNGYYSEEVSFREIR